MSLRAPPVFSLRDAQHPLAIKERLGHADVLTTFRKYGHLFQGVQEGLTAQLEELHQRALEAAHSGEIVELHKGAEGRG